MVFKARKQKGSAIIEAGPAMWFLFIMFFFFIDLMSIAAIYGFGWYYNHMLGQELAVNREVDGDAVTRRVRTAFENSAFASFLKVRSIDDANITYNPAGGGLPPTITVQTTVEGEPFLTVPWAPADIPGITGPIAFTTADVVPRENIQ